MSSCTPSYVLLGALLRVTSTYLDIVVDCHIRSIRYIDDARSSVRRRRSCTIHNRAFCSFTHDLPSPSHFLTLATFLRLCRSCLSSFSASQHDDLRIYASRDYTGLCLTGAKGSGIQGFASKGNDTDKVSNNSRHGHGTSCGRSCTAGSRPRSHKSRSHS